MRTARLLTVSHGGSAHSLWIQIPLPWLQTLPTPANADSPGHVTCDACWVANPHPPVNRITDGCKNITLPQTSFADSKNVDTVLKNDYKRFSSKMSAPRDDCIQPDIPTQTCPPPGFTHFSPQKELGPDILWTDTPLWKHNLPTTSLSGGNDDFAMSLGLEFRFQRLVEIDIFHCTCTVERVL